MSEHHDDDDIREIKKDVKSILRQLPNDETLKTEGQCKNHRESIMAIITLLGLALGGLAGWVFYLSSKMGG